MERSQLKLSLGNDYIADLLEKNSALFPEDLKIYSISCGEEKITVVGEFKNFDFTAILKTSVEPENDRFGIILDEISLSRPDDSVLKNIFWNFQKNVFFTIGTAFSGGRECAVVNQIKNIFKNPGASATEAPLADDGAESKNDQISIVSAEGKILYFDIDALKKLPPFNVAGKITAFNIFPDGIELVVG
ncbi:MAG: hypothetical protein MJ078_04235 [Clostridia bacterium]|nr:hypothetical protein [Clostridia bacterium]